MFCQLSIAYCLLPIGRGLRTHQDSVPTVSPNFTSFNGCNAHDQTVDFTEIRHIYLYSL